MTGGCRNETRRDIAQEVRRGCLAEGMRILVVLCGGACRTIP